MKILDRHFLGIDTSFAYPHSNGFLPSESALVYCANSSGDECQLRLLKLATLDAESLPPIPAENSLRPMAGISYDVALSAPRIVAVCRGRLWLLRLDREAAWQPIYTPLPGAELQDLPSISPDGRKLLTGEIRSKTYAVVEIDTATLQAHTLFEHSWHANHFHYCPHDPEWVGFSHEGPTGIILDRCWVWHPRLAPKGRCVFDQFSAAKNPAFPLNVGHERWAFHDASAYVVAYAVSPGGKRGLYEIYADGRPARLLRESSTMWHCNMDATGRYAVIDTSASWDPKPAVGTEFEAGVAAHLKADRERLPNISDVVLLDLTGGTDLPIARVVRSRHPYHPHPAISMDSQWLVYNDANPNRKGAWVVHINCD